MVDKLVCVLIDDCSKVFDISSACTLRARRESRYGSFELVDALRLCEGSRRARRGETGPA